VVQLTLLGYVLGPIFAYQLWWLVTMYAAFMLLMGGLEAVQSPAYSYKVRII
jgi:ABC-type iron transport system FetAB permease component